MLTITSARAGRAAEYALLTGTRALLIAQQGRIVLEQYSCRATPDASLRIASGTKSICAGLLAAAVMDGLLEVDEPVSETIGEWAFDPAKRDITIRHLLSLTSGFDPGTVALNRPRVVNAYEHALGLGPVASPGKRFIYGPVRSTSLQRSSGANWAPRTKMCLFIWNDVCSTRSVSSTLSGDTTGPAILSFTRVRN